MGLKRWARKVRRRKPGIYLARTRKHARPGRENGYVGRSNNVELRRRCHLGTCRHPCPPKPWSDLDPRWYHLPLPWWLGWRWCLAPLEALAILLLLPRYNVQLNRRNPRRVSPGRQVAQRVRRDAAGAGYRAEQFAVTWLFRLAGTAFIATGVLGWWLHR
jgi:hypothetical protein